ncbi:MAG: response regulator [Rhodospirillales bacterium]|nr:response regulator [Rhodospirillales bacterium]MCW8862609.1 response regulator [Rhodospirillales bacterium]MCW8951779.1 response regulator [Rhodospirillales bacterium]MCW8970485.1 response regulator [Rhodospirillales bacterium]MCW9002175.1 response regulator [Rhodospirillales bacterium]
MAMLNLERVNFLVVDDNKHMRTLVGSILHALGVKSIIEAEDGADAIRVLRSFPADIVICDWNMEPLDGLDFVRLVRTGKDSPNPYVPIIMLTGHTEMHRVLEARDAGINEFLAKPISAKSIYARITSIIERPRPYVRSKRFFGPDRRRKESDRFNGPDRRKQDANGDGLSPDEVARLLSGK